MKPLNLLVFFTTVMLPLICGGQSARAYAINTDSLLQLIPTQKDKALVHTYDRLFAYYVHRNPKKAKSFLDKAMEVASTLDNKEIDALLLYNEGLYFNGISDYSKALEYLKKSLRLFEEFGDKRMMGTAYNSIGINQKNLGQTAAALESYLSYIKVSKVINKPEEELAPTLMNIGKLYAKLEDYKTSNDYYKQVEEICKKYGLSYGLAITESNRATNLVKTGSYLEALRLYFNAIPYFEENNRQLELGEQYNLIAQTYLAMDSLELSKKNYEKALKISTVNGEKSMIGLAKRGLGDILFKQQQYGAALRCFTESMQKAKESSNTIELVEDYLRLSNTYEKLDDLKSAYHYQKLYTGLHDTIFGNENRKKISALELRHQSEKSEQEIQLQKKEIALLEAKEKAAQQQRLALIGGLIGAIVLFGFIYYGIRQKMKRNSLEREKVSSELAFKQKELTTQALHLAKKNEVLEGLKLKAAELLRTEGESRGYQELIRTINSDQQDDKAWENFSRYFEAVHADFEKTVLEKYPDVTKNELRLMALLKMNLSTKEIANILNISPVGVKKARNRLRKKMGLSPKDALETVIVSI